MRKIGILFSLIFLLTACSNDDGVENLKGFSIGNITTSEFVDDKTYFLVIPLEWNGDDSVIIETVELIKQDEKAVNVDNDRVNYVFYGADVNKETGVYQREDIGEVEDINGFKVDDKSKLVLKIALTDVVSDSNRKMRVKYTIDEKPKEQIIESTMIQKLRTK